MERKLLYQTFCTVLLACVLCLPTIPASMARPQGSITYGTSDDGTHRTTQLSFAAFADTHIGAGYQDPLYRMAHHLDSLAEDLTNGTNQLDFAIHLGDIVNHNTAQVSGTGLPWYVNQYTNNLAAVLLSHVHIPFFGIIGNHDVDDYQLNPDDPHNLTKALIDELCITTPMYAMMHDGILFLFVPELGIVTWTHPVEYAWINFMTSQFPQTTTVICCHQAIVDTTKDESNSPYRGKQDMGWWADLFQRNPQIKLWIHGHNHVLDWYLNNQSTGQTNPIQYFGHPMAFSSPYSQMNWNLQPSVDRIVIYNITATSITTAAWEDRGFGGHWASGYSHTWTVPTTFDPDAIGWYAVPVLLQDNETQSMNLKMLSPNVTLQLVGTDPMELFFDSRMQSPSGSSNNVILGFGNDRSGNVEWTDPGMRVHGPTRLTFPEKYPDNSSLQEDGRSGQPYHAFPMGTIAAAVPGQTYNFTMTARCPSGAGRLVVNVSSCDWGTRSQYSMLAGSENLVLSHRFGAEYETISGQYTVPGNENAWFLQGTLDFLDSTDYDVSLFSVKRAQTSDTTEDFHIRLNDLWYNASGPLTTNKLVNFSVDPRNLADDQGVMTFSSRIDGNRYGMVNLFFHEPLLMGQNARFQITNYSNGVFNISLTTTITRTSPALMRLWQSTVFQKFPKITEVFARVLMAALPDRFQELLAPNASSTFTLMPFSTNPRYDFVTVTAADGSGRKHTSQNGNIWWSCQGPDTGKRYLSITIPAH